MSAHLPPDSNVEITLISFLAGVPPDAHPDLLPFLNAGWSISHMAPRIVEGKKLKHLVVLERSAAQGPATP